MHNLFGAFSTEIGLIALALGCLVLDIFLPDDERRGRTLASVAMIGVAVLFFQLCFQWGHFGKAFAGTIVQDGMALYFKGLFFLGAFLTLFMAREYQDKLKRGHAEFVLLILFALVGMVFVASASDFLVLFVAIETMTISFYIMTAYLRDRETSIEAGVKYLVLGALSTAIFLYGLSFIYGSAGSTSFAAIAARVSQGSLPLPFFFGVVLVIAYLCFKISAVPFQLWAPDIYEGAPTPVTAYLAIGSKAAGFAALVRLLQVAFAPAQSQLFVLLAALSALTIIYGNLGAIPQTNIKRLLGYSSIGHAGYMLIGLAAFAAGGGPAVLYYLAAYLFSTGAIFLVLVALSSRLKTDEISELAGLSRTSPLLAAAMLLGLLSLAGVPPLAGFVAKFYLLWSGIQAGLWWLVLIGLLNVITSLYYYLKVVKVMYLDKPLDERPVRVTLDQRIIQYLAIAGIIVLGVWQGPFVNLVQIAFKG